MAMHRSCGAYGHGLAGGYGNPTVRNQSVAAVPVATLTGSSWPSAAVTIPPSQAGRPQAAADLADAAARSRDRCSPLALSDDDAGFIGIG
jgi:hypothetical protein